MGLPGSVPGIPQIGKGFLKILCRVIAAGQILPNFFQRIQQSVQCVQCTACVIQNVCQIVQRLRDPSGKFIDFVNVAVGPVRHGIGQFLGDVLGVPDLAGEIVHLGVDGVGNAASVVSGTVHDILKRIQLGQQLVEEILAEGLQDLRLQLAHDAAHVLSSADGAGVDTAIQPAGAAAGNAADIIADLVIAHGAAVGAALDGALGIACHTADVRISRDVFHRVNLGQICIVGLGIVFQIVGVDAAAVGTAGQGPAVFAHHAGGGMFAGNAAGEGTAHQLAAGFIDTYQTADAVITHDGAGGDAVQDPPGVAAGQQAQFILMPIGVDGARHRQILNGGAVLNVTEQTPDVAAAGKGQAGDGVSVALECAAEGGNRSEVNTVEVKIVLQDHSFSLRPGIQRAVPGQFGQILGGFDGNGALSRQRSGSGQGKQQGHSHEKGGPFLNAFHWASPSFPVTESAGGVFGVSSGDAPASGGWPLPSGRS